MNSYDAGDPIRLIGTFVNSSSAMADPTSVFLHIVPPTQFGAVVPGTIQYTYASGSITKATTGSYYFDINPIPSGTYGVWTYGYNGTGALNAAFVGQFMVRQMPRG
jgi:hypothetical protein